MYSVFGEQELPPVISVESVLATAIWGESNQK